MFLKWYIPNFGYLGFVVWMNACFGVALLVDRLGKRAPGR
jgi:hypothetical protein